MKVQPIMTGSLEPPVLPSVANPPLPPADARPRRRAVAAAVGSSLLIASALAVLFLFDPVRHGFYPHCPFHAMTGWHCPGCGALRGAHELVHGHVLAAMRMNPLVFVGLPLLGLLFAGRRFRNRSEPATAFLQSPLAGWLLLAAILLFWILRNIPIHPFTLLAP